MNFPVLYMSLILVCSLAIYGSHRIHILEGSSIYLDGSTNVNTFRCYCEDRFEPMNIEVVQEPARLVFKKSLLKMTTKKLNCRNEKINRDMYLALKADEYPQISAEVLENWSDSEKSKKLNVWFDAKARIRLTITKVTREVFVKGIARRTSANTIEFQGKTAILLTQYGITPPQAMFGMIMVNDQIVLHLNLKVKIE